MSGLKIIFQRSFIPTLQFCEQSILTRPPHHTSAVRCAPCEPNPPHKSRSIQQRARGQVEPEDGTTQPTRARARRASSRNVLHCTYRRNVRSTQTSLASPAPPTHARLKARAPVRSAYNSSDPSMPPSNSPLAQLAVPLPFITWAEHFYWADDQ